MSFPSQGGASAGFRPIPGLDAGGNKGATKLPLTQLEQDHTVRQLRMEKHRLALSSFLVALVMTALKLAAGLASGSLGILSDAAHAALDTLAVLLTYLAVRVSDKPADREHTYGHGKIESLAAVVQTLILLVACLWIFREAVDRIFIQEVRIRGDWWTFGVMLLSIVVDYSRSRVLIQGANKYASPALEADAYHFTLDMLCSGLVITGLVLTKLAGDRFHAADAFAAISVVGITFWFSLQLGKRAFDTLMDRAPSGMVELVKQEVEKLDDVINAHRVRVRRSGPTIFVDLHVSVQRALSSERSHAIAEQVEKRVQGVVPRSEVLVHVDPVSTKEESVYDRISLIARNHAMSIHNINVYQEQKRIHADLHLEVGGDLDLRRAHDEASRLENRLRKELPELARVNIHIEGRGQSIDEGQDVTAAETNLTEAVRKATGQFAEILNTHNIHVRKIGNQICIYLHCTFRKETSIARVHELTTQIEDVLKPECPSLGRIMIHAEPEGKK